MLTQGMKGGLVAIRCVEPRIQDWLNTVPPLGTKDFDGNPTSEISNDDCIAGTYKKSQAYMGLFEQIYGKLGLTVNIDEDQTDSIELNTGRGKTKGYQNVEGTLELEMLNDNGRWEGAAQGNWQYTALGYYPRERNRLYDLWIMQKPNTKTLSAGSAERLWKCYGVTLGRAEFEMSQPNKFRVPFHAQLMIPLMNWSEPSAVKLLDDEAVVDDSSVSLSTPISTPQVFETRLKFSFTAVTTAKTLTIRGYNIFGEQVTEEVDLSAESGAFVYVTKAQFAIVNANGVTLSGGWNAGTFDIDEYDVGLIPS